MPRKASQKSQTLVEQDKIEELKSQISSFKENKDPNHGKVHEKDSVESKKEREDKNQIEEEDPNHEYDYALYKHCQKIEKSGKKLNTKAIYARLDDKGIECDREHIKKRIKLMLEFGILENVLYKEKKHLKDKPVGGVTTKTYGEGDYKFRIGKRSYRLSTLKVSIAQDLEVAGPYRRIAEMMEEQLNETIQDMKNMTIEK